MNNKSMPWTTENSNLRIQKYSVYLNKTIVNLLPSIDEDIHLLQIMLRMNTGGR